MRILPLPECRVDAEDLALVPEIDDQPDDEIDDDAGGQRPQGHLHHQSFRSASNSRMELVATSIRYHISHDCQRNPTRNGGCVAP